MKILFALILLAPAATFGQIDVNRELKSGSPQAWPPTTISFTYNVPEPVGPIELTFGVEIDPIIARNLLDLSDNLRLVAGRVTYRDMGTIDLPARFLVCLPQPRPKEAHLSTLYIDPSDSGRPWPEEFTTYVEIPFGQALVPILDGNSRNTPPWSFASQAVRYDVPSS